MTRTKKTKVPTAVVNRWKRDYRALEPIDRVRNTHAISLEAKKLVPTHGPSFVRSALLEVVNGDRPSAARLQRVANFPKSLLNEALRSLKESKGVNDRLRTDTKPHERGTRSNDGTRAQRTAGFSLTHLLALASVKNSRVQKKLLKRSLEQCWSSSQMRSAVSKAGSACARPKGLGHAIKVKSQALLDAIESVNERSLEESIKGMKIEDRRAAVKEYRQAIALLTKISGTTDRVVETLSNIKVKIAPSRKRKTAKRG